MHRATYTISFQYAFTCIYVSLRPRTSLSSRLKCSLLLLGWKTLHTWFPLSNQWLSNIAVHIMPCICIVWLKGWFLTRSSWELIMEGETLQEGMVMGRGIEWHQGKENRNHWVKGPTSKVTKPCTVECLITRILGIYVVLKSAAKKTRGQLKCHHACLTGMSRKGQTCIVRPKTTTSSWFTGRALASAWDACGQAGPPPVLLWTRMG